MRSRRDRQKADGTVARPSLYQEVTDKIVVELEAGRVAWVQPWSGARAGLGLPLRFPGRHYSCAQVRPAGPRFCVAAARIWCAPCAE
jgi:antirestriction protein ArdC